MKFSDLFKDDNQINEKAVVGFIAFVVMIIAMAVDLVTGYFGKDLIINEFIYNSFLILCLGCFGIASVDKYINKTNSGEDQSE